MSQRQVKPIFGEEFEPVRRRSWLRRNWAGLVVALLFLAVIGAIVAKWIIDARR